MAAEVARLLDRRASALVAGDERGYASTVADPASREGRVQLAGYAAFRALGVSRLEVGPLSVQPAVPATPSTPGRSAHLDRAVRAEADVRYRVGGLDTADRAARLAFTLDRSGSGWAVVREEAAGAGAGAPWVVMPHLRVERGVHAVVAGTAPAARLAELVEVVDRAVPGLATQWAGTPGRVLVLAPARAAEADGLLGRSVEGGVDDVAATTEGPTGPAGTATGDRIVLDPTAFGRLTPAGRDVVLTHELAHVAVRATVPGRAAGWLAEGYADHVGYARADVPAARVLAPLLEEVRAGRGPHDLPTARDLDPASAAIELPYLGAWQAVELLVAEHGEAALRRFVLAGSSTGSDADAEAATDAALLAVLGTSRGELVRAWQGRLRRLAG